MTIEEKIIKRIMFVILNIFLIIEIIIATVDIKMAINLFLIVLVALFIIIIFLCKLSEIIIN